jgi:hypothetical protein
MGWALVGLSSILFGFAGQGGEFFGLELHELAWF